jgi:hypothetical protein
MSALSLLAVRAWLAKPPLPLCLRLFAPHSAHCGGCEVMHARSADRKVQRQRGSHSKVEAD